MGDRGGEEGGGEEEGREEGGREEKGERRKGRKEEGEKGGRRESMECLMKLHIKSDCCGEKE